MVARIGHPQRDKVFKQVTLSMDYCGLQCLCLDEVVNTSLLQLGTTAQPKAQFVSTRVASLVGSIAGSDAGRRLMRLVLSREGVPVQATRLKGKNGVRRVWWHGY